jgi:hypothetical protein
VELPVLTDVDTLADLWPVADLLPAESRFRRAVEELGPTR